jgi:hypothetical protein
MQMLIAQKHLCSTKAKTRDEALDLVREKYSYCSDILAACRV